MSIIVMQNGLEATLSDSKKKYGDKVNALLSAWEHVTNFIPAASPDTIKALIEWAHKHTLKLVLRGEWPKLQNATKTHLSVTLKRCAENLENHLASRCTTLVDLVHNPWSNPALEKILNGQPDGENEEAFCCSEKGELLTMRLKILCEDRCEDIAVNLAAACVRSLRRSEALRSASEVHHVQYMFDVYIVLLFKLKRTQDIFAQLTLMDLEDGLELVQRLSGEKPIKYGKARVWKNSTKAAELVVQYLVTVGMVRPVSETGANVLEQILNSWALLHSKLKETASTLPGMIRKLIEPAESAQHIYILCTVLMKHFGGTVKPLVIELYIRALTTDMNELESQKTKADKEKARETAKRLSVQFLKLADFVVSNIGIARECVLTAFSLNPTRECYDRIKEIAIACGKIKKEINENGEDEEIKRFQNMSNSSLNDVNEKKDVIDFSATTNLDTNMGKSTLSSMCASTTAQNIRKNIEFQSGTSKSFQHTDEILKTILTSSLNSEGLKLEKCTLHPKRDPSLNGPIGELCFNCGEFTGIEATPPSPETNNIERTLDALILIKGDAVTGSANYDEKTVPNQVLDAEKLGLSPQLCDDLAVVLSSPRYHMLSWVLDWNELNTLCERYLENAEEMRNTNKELKYLNIDYSQFKDWPSEDESKDEFFGIEKGYEQWADIPSDSSEQYGSFQPAGNYKRTTARRSLDDTTDSESESVVQVRRRGRPRKVHPVVSSESDYDSTENKPKHFRNRTLSVSDSDTNTQDSQTDSLGSDGFRPDAKKSNKPCVKENSKKHGKSKLTVETVSHFHMLVNEAIRHPAEDVSGSDVSSNDIITLFSADLDENKRETIKGSTYTAAAPLIITEKRSDPDVLKSLRMFRPKNSKKPRISQILQKNLLNKSKDNNNINDNSNSPTKYAPMLSTLNLNPKIVLTRTDDVQGKRKPTKKQFNRNDLTTKLINIQKTMPFHQNKNSIVTYQKQRNGRINSNAGSVDGRERVCSVKSNLGKTKFDILAQAVRDSDILAKNVPGLNSLDMMIPPRIQSTVNVVQLSRNIPPSPSTVSGNSGNTPPRNRTSSNTGNIQLPGTPSSGGHDSGVGMSPAGQTPPPRSSSMHDVGDEANQPPDASPTDSINASTLETDSPRTINNQRSGQSQSPKKSPSPSTTTATTVPIGSEQIQIVCKPDGTYQLASVNPNILTNQRSVLALQNLDDGTVGFSRNVVNRNTFDRLAPIKTTSQAGHNTGLPKFQHAFGKTIYTLSTDTTTVAASSTTETLTQPTTIQKASNLSKAVQTSVPSTQANTASLSIQSIAGVQNLQLSSGRQILNIVQSSTASSTNTTTPTVTQTLTQLVQNMHNASSGVIYTHKIPVTISTTNPSQLNIIPTITPANSLTGNRTPVVKLNIIRAPIRQQNIGTIQAVLATPRMPQPTVRPETTLINTPIDVPNQVSSTTLEQLREFESVLEQVKERSTIQPQNQNTTTTTVQTQTQTAPSPQLTPTKPVSTLTQQLLIPSQTPNSSKFSNGNTVTFPDSFSQKVSLAYVNQTSTPPKVTNSTPVVVVTSYCQPAASPALSVTSQSSSSPCVTPAPAPIQSSGKTPPTASPKSSKKSTPKTVKTSATNTAKASPIPKPQQKPQEDEKTAQRIYAILTQYAEQLRNSPDLNNKPAPRRRSNPPTNPSQSSKRKKSSSGKSKSSGQQSSELSPSAEDLGRTMGSEDSSSGIAQVQDSPAGFTTPDEPSTASNANDATDNRTNDSNDGVEQLNNIKRRNLIFTEPNASGGQRAVIVQESGSVSVSEALASVTGKMGSTAVLMSGNYQILPMNLMKGAQQFTIVSGGSKLLATVPATVRTTGTTGVSNALVLQSFLNQGKIISSQPTQVKQVKIPTLQTLTNQQSATIVIPQNNAQFDEKNNEIIAKETTTTTGTNAILVNKTIGLIQRNLSDVSDNICGVITSNPNLTLQGARFFNSTIAKLSTPGEIKTESVVCLASSTPQNTIEKKTTHDNANNSIDSKTVSLQNARIALAYATPTEVSVINNSNNQQRETKEISTEISASDKIISPKTVKRKLDDSTTTSTTTAVGLSENIPRILIAGNNTVSSAITTPLQTNIKLEPGTTTMTSVSKQVSNLDNTSQFLITGGPSSSDSQQSPIRQSIDSIDSSGKIGNGILCGNARLQEAWEPDRKPSPDTPWRYVPTSTNSLNIEPYKISSRDSESTENVLQIINKNQTIELSSGNVFQPNAKKYFINHSLETYQQYSNKNSLAKSHPSQRELLQQRAERKNAALERELKLQKSLSEECEDLGVDEPSTSDLFPEADLLFDNNHSPSFDHSSQDATCSQSLGIKPYCSSYFRSLDSSSGSRDASPIADLKANERRRNVVQRTRTLKDTVKRAKREKVDELHVISPVKHMRLSLDNLSQDDASNSNSDLSRLSPGNIPSTENDSSKDNTTSRVKLNSRRGSKEGTPSSLSSTPSNIKLDIDIDTQSLPAAEVNTNNTSITSSGDESLTLLGANTADVTITSPLSPIAGPLLSTHKYTYSNKKRVTTKIAGSKTGYLSWESPMSERTRSSSEDDDSSISDSLNSQPEDNTLMTNGLDDSMLRTTSNVKITSDHCTYLKAKDKLHVTARVVLNRADPKHMLAKRFKSDSISETNVVVTSDKTSEASDDETSHNTSVEPDCRARRSSLRGHVKKGCACCNGSPERPKKKPVKLDHKLKKRLSSSKQLGKKR
ncbi:mucin-4-like isoform X2 [Leptopilina boulardi]|uniref:mucin-4-like isoform X2 n=1 Tax=Leptopilina boulardi TaxID=63433 RepID=UPI0021F6934B|nr:mucin-4-like isoform X2 [Leptopilina boulardi]